jgi:hypothetical protein
MSAVSKETTSPSVEDNWKIFDAHNKLAWDVTNFYARGITFFLAINAAIFGYVLKVEIEPVTKRWICLFGLVTAILFLLCSFAFVFCILGIWRTVQACVLSGDAHAIKRYFIPQNFVRGRLLFAAFAFGSITLIVLIIAGYSMLLLR